MNVFLCTTQPEVFCFLTRRIQNAGNNCIMFSNLMGIITAIDNSKIPPDLVIMDYTLENHLVTDNPYDRIYKKKLYMPLIFYNDPCIAEGARVSVWKELIKEFNDKKFIPEGRTNVPKIEDIEKILVIVNNFIESEDFRPYIKLMQRPKPFPKNFTIDYLAQSMESDLIHYNRINTFKEEHNLSENLYALLQIFFDSRNIELKTSQILKMYAQKKAKISEKSLGVLISNLRKAFKEAEDCTFSIKKVPGGYKFSAD